MSIIVNVDVSPSWRNNLIPFSMRDFCPLNKKSSVMQE